MLCIGESYLIFTFGIFKRLDAVQFLLDFSDFELCLLVKICFA